MTSSPAGPQAAPESSPRCGDLGQGQGNLLLTICTGKGGGSYHPRGESAALGAVLAPDPVSAHPVYVI